MPERGKDPSVSLKENPAMPDEMPTRPGFNKGVDPERPQELVDRLEEIEAQDVTAPGPQETHPRPYALQGEDEGPLGEGGQLRYSDAGGGGSS
jgi:hypothetical protein